MPIPSVHFSHKRYTLIILLLSLVLSACSDSQPSADLRGKRQSQGDSVAKSERTSNQFYATLTGRAVKGIVQYAEVSAYRVQSGQFANKAMASAVSDGDGQFSIYLPRWRFRQLAYLEISATPSSQPSSAMVCDAYSGCGSRDGVTIHYGDSFPLLSGVLMRNVAMLRGGSNAFIGNFSPIRHAAVARAEAKTGGVTWSNMKKAESELAELFLLAKPARELTPVNLLSVAETEAASDEQVVLAILEASFLNIGVSPNYKPVEEVLGRVTALGGQFESHVTGDFYRLSLHNLLRAAYHNIPDYLAHRPGIKAHLLGIIEARTPSLSLELGASSPANKVAATFTLQVLSNGGGSVKALPSGDLCTISCEYTFSQGESISLTPVADEGYEFSHWEADCDGSEGICDLLMEDQKTASAVFKSSQQEATLYSLSLNISGAGQVVEQNSSSLCSEEGCSALLEQGQSVMLVASAYDGYQFDGWSGDCSGTASCSLSIDGNKAVTAHFSPVLVQLTIELKGQGSVVSTSGLSCSSSPCQFSVPLGETVSLVANSSSGFQLDSWGAACGGKSTCTVTVDRNKRVVANFSPIMHQVTLRASSGGLIANGDQSLVCSESTCTFDFAEGSLLGLTTLAKSGYQFESWGGACSGTGTCSLEVKQDMTVSANFSSILHTLTVSVSEGGSVSSLAADLNCSAGVCSTQVQEGKKITLSALSSNAYDFESWSGQCAGSGADCSIIVESDVGLSASFSPPPEATQMGSIFVTWSAPLEREDGSPLPSGDIRSYTIYYGQMRGEYSDSLTLEVSAEGSVPTSATLQSLEKGNTYYVAGITVDTNGVSSQLSNEIVKTAN